MDFTIAPDDSVMMIGSCFTENMGHRMQDLRFDVAINPFGILYNPLSIAEALTRCLDGTGIDDSVLVEQEDLWHSWLHHGSFSRPDKQSCLEACNTAIAEAHDFMGRCN